jgi:adenylate kinase family enzyme
VGPPGSGKGTLCAALANKLTFCHHIALGDIIRQKKLHHLTTGTFIPPQIIAALIESEILRTKPRSGGMFYIVEGFPVCLQDYEYWKSTGYATDYPILSVISLTVKEELGVARCLERGRADDTLTAIRRRYALFRQRTLPVLDVLKSDFQISFHPITSNQAVLTLLEDAMRSILFNLRFRYLV